MLYNDPPLDDLITDLHRAPSPPAATDLDQLIERSVIDAIQRATPLRDAAPTPSFTGYERLPHKRAAPPGIPHGYVLEVTTHHCTGCGSTESTSRLLTVESNGFSRRVTPLGGSSPVYDRAISRINKSQVTPVCLYCIEDLKPLPVAYPTPGRAVGLYSAIRARDEAAAPSSPKPLKRVPKTITIADDDFI